MNAQKFNSLPISEQAIIMWDKGKFLQLWEENPVYKIGIYLLFDKITAVYYDRNLNAIIKIKMWGSAVDKQEILENTVLN